MASNCSPCIPPPSLPTSDLPIHQPTNRPARQLTIQPTRLLSPCQTSNTPASPPPPRVLTSPTRIQAITPTTFQVHQQEAHQNASTHQAAIPLTSHCGTTEMRCPPRDHPQGHDAPPDSSLLKHPAISHTKPCPTSLALVSQKSPALIAPNLLAQHHKQYTGPLIDIKEYCYGVVHPVTKETITHYRKLITNTIFYLSHTDICKIPQDRTATYARIVIDHRPQKEDPNCVRM